MPRILLVDDDDLLLEVMTVYLADLGYEATMCNDPTSAASLGEKISPQIAILDFEMPQRSGTEVLADFRSSKTLRDLPVIFLSGVEPLRYSSRVPPDPRVRFLQKPVNFENLRDAIAQMLDPDGWSAP